MTARLYRQGHIHRMDGAGQLAEAILAENGLITAVGGYSEIKEQLVGPVQEFDLAGRHVLPGLIDSHIHSAGFAREMTALDLRGVSGLAEALERVNGFATSHSAGEWVFGGRWDSNTWDVPVQPDRQSLDSVCADKPVAMPSIDGHTVWVNSLALKLIGVSRDTPDPVGGEIVRDADGEPTGILRESARYPIRDLMNSPLSGDLIGQLRRGQEHLLSVGLTGIHDLDGEDSRSAYLQMRAEGDLKLRVHKSIPMEFLDQAIEEGRFTGDGDEWFSTGPVKLFSDGALGSHTSHMGAPFPGEHGNHGIEVIAYPELLRLIGTAARAGIAVATHAIGDQANHLVLNAYAELRHLARPRRLRHRIEHSQHLRHEDVRRFAGLGVIPSMQPTHCTSDIPLSNALLADRELANYPWRALIDAGAALAFGSDAPVEDPNPFFALHAAVTRQNAHGTPLGGWEPEERLDLSTAFAAHTRGPAYAAGMESQLGELSPGRLADFIVLDEDPFTVAPQDLRDLSVLTTVVGGEVQFQR